MKKTGRNHCPTLDELEYWSHEGVADATDGCKVEPDGTCEHGKESWFLVLGLIQKKKELEMTTSKREDAIMQDVIAGKVIPHVAKRMEVGAILCASWGYEQTNVDWFCIVGATDKTVWTLPMSTIVEKSIGWASELVMPGNIKTSRATNFCETCDHREGVHGEGVCYHYDDTCDCSNPIFTKQNIPGRHRKGTYVRFSSCVAAGLWKGEALYSSSYA